MKFGGAKTAKRAFASILLSYFFNCWHNATFWVSHQIDADCQAHLFFTTGIRGIIIIKFVNIFDDYASWAALLSQQPFCSSCCRTVQLVVFTFFFFGTKLLICMDGKVAAQARNSKTQNILWENIRRHGMLINNRYTACFWLVLTSPRFCNSLQKQQKKALDIATTCW